VSYPYGSYGQGFPPQSGGPQQPGFPPQPFPQPGFPQQPFAAAPQKPSGVTGIIAGVLAGLGGLANFVGGIAMAFGLAIMIGASTDATGSTDNPWTGLIAITVLNVVSGLLLLIGTVTLLLRKMVGRWLVVAGCAVSILSTLINLTLLPSFIADYEYDRGVGPDLVGVMFAITTIVLVLLPSTTAWIKARQYPVAPQFYPPYPG